MNKLACGCTSIRDHIRRLRRDANGATAIEYAMIASGVGAAIAATIYNLGTTVSGFYSTLAAML